MGKGLWITIIVILIVLIRIFVFSGNGDDIDLGDSLGDVAGVSAPGSDEVIGGPEGVVSQTKTVRIMDSGFNPPVLTINKGDTVTFVNKANRKSWPASDIHPTHTVYPGSGVEKCGTAEEGEIFDACRGLEKEESWSFTFNEEGVWQYHDHLRAALGGKIIVS
ncbi:MAG: hypothetical protein QGF74_02040 [Candidatus Nanoarchaeia archaeon]|jgi:plastocyanin|nr:hypothetical protein [Candidatus Nanoarchaeia archaeon]|tara:strand:- start:48952 stop:49440 length:489 start_codon:yes stop_codon:yes gene_type:complete